MALIVSVERFSTWQAAGGVREAFLMPPASAEHEESVDGTDRLTMAWPKDYTKALALVRNKVAVVRFSDGSTLERIVVNTVLTSGTDDLLYQVECLGLGDYLRRTAPIRLIDGDGFVYSDVPAVGLTPSVILSSIILAKAPSWVAAGTVTPTERDDFQFTNDNAHSGLIRYTQATNQEFTYRPVGTTSWAVDIGIVGAGSTGPTIRTGKNLRSMSKRIGAAQTPQVTKVNVFGPASDEGSPATLGWAFWKASAVSGGNVTMAPIHGAGGGPFKFTSQGVDAEITNLCKRGFATWWTAGSGAPSSLDNVVISGDYCLDRVSDSSAVTFEYFIQTVTFTGDGTKAFSFLCKKGSSPPPGTDKSYVQIFDNTAGVGRGSISLSFDGAGVLTAAGSIGVLLGTDNLGNGIYRVRAQATGVVAANTNHVRVLPNGDTAGNTGNVYIGHIQVEDAATPSRLKRPWWVERVDGTVAEVLTTDGTTQVMAVSNPTGITAGDWVRLLATPGGEQVTTLDAPTDVARDGTHPGDFTSPWDDTLNLIDNPLCIDYATPSSFPDGYSSSGGTWAKDTTTGNYITGGQSAKCTFSVVGNATLLSRSKSWYIRHRRSTFSATCWIRITALSGGNLWFQLTKGGVGIGEKLYYRSPINSWVQLKIEGANLAANELSTQTLGFALGVDLDPGSGSATGTFYFDSVQVAPSLTARPIVWGSASARAWQDGNEWLDDNRGTPISAVIDAVDLGRAGNPVTSAIALGATHPVIDEELGDTLSVRVVRRRRNLVNDKLTEVEVSTARPRLKSKLAKPVAPVVPFFEPVRVQAAARDTRQAAQTIKAAITTTTATQVTITLTHSDLQNGTPTVSYATVNATYSSGSGLGPYVFNRPATGTGIGRVVFTSQIPGRSDVTDAVDVPEMDLDVGSIVGTISAKSGTFDFHLEGSVTVASWKYAVSTSAMPADATVRAASAVNGRQVDVSSAATLALDGKVYVKAIAYTGASGGGTEAGGFITGTFRRDTSSKTGKVKLIPASAFIPVLDTTQYGTWMQANAYVGGTAPAADRYVVFPRVAGGNIGGQMPLELPPGVTVTLVRCRLFRGGAGAVASVTFTELDPANGVLNSSISTMAQASGTEGWVSSGAISKTLSASFSYGFSLTLTNRAATEIDAHCACIEVTYTCPDYETTV